MDRTLIVFLVFVKVFFFHVSYSTVAWNDACVQATTIFLVPRFVWRVCGYWIRIWTREQRKGILIHLLDFAGPYVSLKGSNYAPCPSLLLRKRRKWRQPRCLHDFFNDLCIPVATEVVATWPSRWFFRRSIHPRCGGSGGDLGIAVISPVIYPSLLRRAVKVSGNALWYVLLAVAFFCDCVCAFLWWSCDCLQWQACRVHSSAHSSYPRFGAQLGL